MTQGSRVHYPSTYAGSSYKWAGIEMYSFARCSVQLVSGASACVLMKPIDSVAFRPMKAVISCAEGQPTPWHRPVRTIAYKLNHGTNSCPRLPLIAGDLLGSE